jgi:hypothetical protein
MRKKKYSFGGRVTGDIPTKKRYLKPKSISEYSDPNIRNKYLQFHKDYVKKNNIQGLLTYGNVDDLLYQKAYNQMAKDLSQYADLTNGTDPSAVNGLYKYFGHTNPEENMDMFQYEMGRRLYELDNSKGFERISYKKNVPYFPSKEEIRQQKVAQEVLQSKARQAEIDNQYGKPEPVSNRNIQDFQLEPDINPVGVDLSKGKMRYHLEKEPVRRYKKGGRYYVKTKTTDVVPITEDFNGDYQGANRTFNQLTKKEKNMLKNKEGFAYGGKVGINPRRNNRIQLALGIESPLQALAENQKMNQEAIAQVESNQLYDALEFANQMSKEVAIGLGNALGKDGSSGVDNFQTNEKLKEITQKKDRNSVV